MGLIDERILEQMRMAGKPRTSTIKQTSNTTQTAPGENLNLMGMGTLLTMLLNMLDQSKTTTSLAQTPLQPGRNFSDALNYGGYQQAPAQYWDSASLTTLPIDALLKMYLG